MGRIVVPLEMNTGISPYLIYLVIFEGLENKIILISSCKLSFAGRPRIINRFL